MIGLGKPAGTVTGRLGKITRIIVTRGHFNPDDSDAAGDSDDCWGATRGPSLACARYDTVTAAGGPGHSAPTPARIRLGLSGWTPIRPDDLLGEVLLESLRVRQAGQTRTTETLSRPGPARAPDTDRPRADD
jgi:hypothetical protein